MTEQKPEAQPAAPATDTSAEVDNVDEAATPPVAETPVEEKQADQVNLVEHTPADEPRSPEEPAAEAQPAEQRPADETPAVEEPAAEAAEAQPAEARPAEQRTADETPAVEAKPTPAAPVPTPATMHVPSPASLAARLHGSAQPKPSAHGRVDESGTVFVRTPEGEREVGSYPGASPAEALGYFTRKYDELLASADLLLQRVLHTDLSARDGSDGLAKLREQAADARVVGDLAVLETRIAEIASAVDAKKAAEGVERSAAREAGRVKREELVLEAEKIAGQPEAKIQWKTSGTRMRALLDEWKALQRNGPKLDRESETALWQRFSAARNTFDKARRVYFAQLEGTQSEARVLKEQLVKEAELLATSKDWSPTATAFKRLMDRWREAGRTSRSDDDALWARFKTAQDSFFNAKDEIVAAENEEFTANLVVKETLLAEAEALLPVTDIEAAKASLRVIQDKWERAGKVPRPDVERIEKAMRRVEQTIRETDEKRWASINPEAAARAQSLVDQLEKAVDGLRKDLEKAQS
ncbi:MAG TPA: DUF349 domain-containing protein, partial [Dermatophilaceae bacterium]|nr:DUF349 domain-containing protein [Dermatophilaceae bacterium]